MIKLTVLVLIVVIAVNVFPECQARRSHHRQPVRRGQYFNYHGRRNRPFRPRPNPSNPFFCRGKRFRGRFCPKTTTVPPTEAKISTVSTAVIISQFIVDTINGKPANFTDALLDHTSDEYMELADLIIAQFDAALADVPGYIMTVVEKFQEGSVEAVVISIFNDADVGNVEDLAEDVKEEVDNAPSNPDLEISELETELEEDPTDGEETTESGSDGEETTESGSDGEETTESGSDGEETTEYVTDGEETTEYVTDGEETTEYVTDGEETTEYVSDGEETTESGSDGEKTTEFDCGEKPACSLKADSTDDISIEEEIVTLHNYYRCLHGVADLEINAELTADAKFVVDAFASGDQEFDHFLKKHGENLYYAMTSNPSALDVCEAVDLWYNEIDDYDFNNPVFDAETGHFTQLVWAATSEIGCALATGEETDGFTAVYVACEYEEPGNFEGQFDENVLRLIE